MLNIEDIKKMAENCPNDEIVIICSHWSINKPKYSDDDAENEDWDMDELSEVLENELFVNDYDDLCIDPHGIYNF